MLNKFLNIFAFKTTPPPQISSLNTELEPLSDNKNNLKSLFSFIFSRYIYVFSFGLLHAFFIYYAMPEQVIFQKEIEYIITNSLLLVALFVLISPYNKYLEVFFYFYANIWATISVFQAMAFNSIFDVPSLYAIIYTTKAETYGFITTFTNLKIILALLVIWFIPLMLLKINNKYQYTGNYKEKFIPLLMSLIFLLYPIHTARTFTEQLKAGVLIKLSNIDMNIRKVFWVRYPIFIPQTLAMNKLNPQIPKDVIAKYEGAQNVILFLTESTNRNQYSIYGYPRDTTPKLKELDLIIYDDVIAPKTITVQSLPLMVTFADLNDPQNFISSIHDIFKAAGFNTYNYNTYKEINTNDLSTILQLRADTFVHDSGSYNTNTISEVLQILKTNQNQKNFIIIFTAAMHAPYNSYYPKEFEAFTDNPPNLYPNANPTRRNQYDTLVKFMDTQIAGFLKEIETIGNTIVLLTSDHGEEVANYSATFGHASSMVYPSLFEIPFMLYFTKDYKQKEGLVFETSRKYQTDNLIHSIIDLANLETSLFDPKRSIFNKEFIEVQRFMHEEDYEIIRERDKTQ